MNSQFLWHDAIIEKIKQSSVSSHQKKKSIYTPARIIFTCESGYRFLLTIHIQFFFFYLATTLVSEACWTNMTTSMLAKLLRGVNLWSSALALPSHPQLLPILNPYISYCGSNRYTLAERELAELEQEVTYSCSIMRRQFTHQNGSPGFFGGWCWIVLRVTYCIRSLYFFLSQSAFLITWNF